MGQLIVVGVMAAVSVDVACRTSTKEVKLRIYTHNEDASESPGFEVENIYVGLNAIFHMLNPIPGVSDVRKRKIFCRWGSVRLRFKFMGDDYIVDEPFDDNSRYWVGPVDPGNLRDITPLKSAFIKYEPGLVRRVIGDVLTLKFVRSLLRWISTAR